MGIKSAQANRLSKLAADKVLVNAQLESTALSIAGAATNYDTAAQDVGNTAQSLAIKDILMVGDSKTRKFKSYLKFTFAETLGDVEMVVAAELQLYKVAGDEGAFTVFS